MVCLEEDVVLAFCAGTLPAEARARAEQHLAGCDECRVLVSAIARTSLAGPEPAGRARKPSAETPLLGSHDVEAVVAAAASVRAETDRSGSDATVGVVAARAARRGVVAAPLDPMAPTTPSGRARGGARTPDGAPENRSPVQPGDVLADKFVVERVLGAGGMGVVVAARHKQLDQRVALKFLLPEACEVPGAVARFLQEGKAAARITSEHVARVVDTGVLEGGAPYLVMEYLEGKDLGAVLAERKRLPWPEAVEYVLQACEAIVEAHELGIVHRDLKPANLFLTHRADGSPLVKVLDFGISKIEGGSRAALTSTSALMGSPRYMSPEQMISAKDVDARTDVWALGVILFELVTGRPVWAADTVQGLCALVTTAPAPPIRAVEPGVPDVLEETILRALVKVRDARLPSVAELARALAPIAPGTARVSIDRIVGVAARSGRPSCAAFVPARVGVPTGQVAPVAGPSTSRITIALAVIVGVLLASGLALNAWVERSARADDPPPAPTTTTAIVGEPAATPPAHHPEPDERASEPSPTSTRPTVLIPLGAAVATAEEARSRSTAPRPKAPAAPRPTTAATSRPPPAVTPSPPPTTAPTPAPIDTSRALVERK